MRAQETIILLQNHTEILRNYHVKELFLFGSLVRGEDKPESDVDMLVIFESDARIGLFEMARLQQKLSEILDKKVDLTTPDALHKAMKGRIIKEALRAA